MKKKIMINIGLWISLTFLISCNGVGASETFTLSSGGRVEVYDYVDPLGNFTAKYPINFEILREHDYEEIISFIQFVRVNSGEDDISLNIQFATGNDLDKQVKFIQGTYGGRWESITFLDDDAKLMEIEIEEKLLISQNLWFHHNDETYVISMRYSTTVPDVEKDAELIWQVVLESFEYLP